MDLLFLHQTFPFLPLFVYPLVHHYECYEFPKVQKIEGFLKYRLQGTDWLDKKMLKSKSAKCNSMVQKKGEIIKKSGTDYYIRTISSISQSVNATGITDSFISLLLFAPGQAPSLAHSVVYR